MNVEQPIVEPDGYGRKGREGCVSLPVLGGGGSGGKGVRASKMGKRRAAALVLVHVLIAAHMAQWVWSGMRDGERNTLSPVEPSESMWTLEQGLVNAGFVMFAVAVLSTLLFGRWFCGWACHVVALQDLCGWMMKKGGVQPRPWRSRLLVWTPLCVALYMFVWPTFRRLVVAPWLGTAQVIEDGRTVHTLPPHWAWLGQSAPFPKDGFEAHFVVEDFWATFPEWYIAVPYLFACGFAVVYFLGAKGFCTYGCPYGGFFGPVDRLSPLRIRVTDACEHCGHCTAVCTSNVRVSDEVRDFGAVVDPGCMKCMDCVSVCPTGALYVGAGAPALFTKARTPAAGWKHKAQKAARYDLTLGEEALCGVVLLATTIGVRGSVLFGFTVPLLMALGLGAINAFVAHKLWRVVRDAHVRGPHVQLKRSGRLTRAGVVFALVGSAALLTAGLGMVTKVCQGMGEYHAAALRERVFPSAERAKWGEINAKFFADTYIPDSEVAARARVALSWFGRADSIWRGGWGLWREPEATAKMGWPALVAGDAALAETVLRRAAGQRWRLDDPVVLDVADVMVLRARREGTLATLNARLEEWYRGALARDHRLLRVRGQLAELLSVSAQRAGKPTDDAAKLLVDAAKAHPGDDDLVDHASMTLLRMGRLSEAREVLELGLSKRPLSAALNVNLAFALAVPNEESRDPATIMRAEKLLSLAQNHVGEDDAATLGKMAQLHQFFGRQAEAAEYQKRAEAAAKRARRE